MDPNLDPRALAAQNSYWAALLQRLGMAPQAMFGGGLAGQAASQLQNRANLLQMQESQALGIPTAQSGQANRGGLLSF